MNRRSRGRRLSDSWRAQLASKKCSRFSAFCWPLRPRWRGSQLTEGGLTERAAVTVLTMFRASGVRICIAVAS